MKTDNIKRAGMVAIILILIVCLSSCGSVWDAISEAVSSLDNTTTADSSAAERQDDTTAAENPVIPYDYPPEIEQYALPAEDFADDLEREASELIDFAIEKAISYVNVMKDDRHAFETFEFEYDANGSLSKLDENEVDLYNRIVEAAKAGAAFEMTEKEYKGDLKAAFFDLHIPLTYCDPLLSTYFCLDAKSYIRDIGEDEFESRYSSVFIRYFDPNYDGNAVVAASDTEKILRKAELLERIVKRVVRFMPDGLSAYDHYYYLAAVLSEKVTYSNRLDDCFTAYGALVDGKAVCEGYACAYFLLCREANLWCAYRDGIPEGTGHAWNMIMLDSGIYNVDVTWCDVVEPYKEKWYENFVKSDADFENHGATSGVPSTGTFEPCPYDAQAKILPNKPIPAGTVY